MADVPKSQYDDLQRRHENMRKNREREQRRCSKLGAECDALRSRITELEAREAALLDKLKVAEEALVLFKFYSDTPKLKATAIEALAKIKEAS